MKDKSVSVLLSFIFICLMSVIVASCMEIGRLNHITEKDAILIDSLKGELDIETFDKSRYISIVDQVSELNCREVKEIIDGTE